jgi:hypothetical protein
MSGRMKLQDAMGCAGGTMDSRLRGNDDEIGCLLHLTARTLAPLTFFGELPMGRLSAAGWALLATSVLSLAGCGMDRTLNADTMAAKAGLVRRTVATSTYTIAAWTRLTRPGQPVSVYIEGDGSAYGPDGGWSPDPTPRRPLGLMLAGQDNGANVIYLARPCQFVRDAHCRPPDWTNRRFSGAAARSLDEVLDQLLPASSRLDLVGYSGGAALAVQLAARRADVRSLTTVSGNLDPLAVNRLHGASETLVLDDPMGLAPQLARLPQRHLVGSRDEVVPVSIARGFVRAEGEAACAVIITADAEHEKGWAEAAPGLLRSAAFPCSVN